MTAINPTGRGVGFRHGQLLAIGTDGYPAATSASEPYLGYDLQGARQLQLTIPDPRIIAHIGDDRVLQLDSLPPTDPVKGLMQVSGADFNINALATGQKAYALGDMKVFLMGTEQQGFNPQLIMLAYRQSLDFDGPRRWEFYLLPKVLLVPKSPSFDDNAEITEYAVIPQYGNTYPWGVEFSLENEGAEMAQYIPGLATGKPRLVAWKADGSTTVFTLPTKAVDIGKVLVFIDGAADATPTIATTTDTTITYTSETKPASGKKVICFYESV